MIRRNTAQKRAVLDVFRTMHNHPSATMVFDEVHRKYPSISRSTVFRILADEAREGSILRLAFTEADDRFDITTMNHYHIYCRRCGSVDDVTLPFFQELERQVMRNSGYSVERHNLEFIGLCPECRKEEANG